MDRSQDTLRLADRFVTRREFLSRMGLGMGSLGLLTLLERSGALMPAVQGMPVAGPGTPLAPKAPHFPATAKRVLHIFPAGGPSHVDTFDPKPMLDKYAWRPLKEVDKQVKHPGAAFPSPFKFNKCGRSGLEISEVFPKTAEHADDLCVVRSMSTETPSHEASMMLVNCGSQLLARPCVGSWVTYGLGTENQNLPGFITLSPGRPLQGDQNW